MGRREKPVDPAAGPVQRFAFELRKLRQEAGGPTYREMAKEAGFSVAALARAAAGEKLPSLELALAYVKTCGGNPAAWELRWREAAAQEAAAPPDQDGDAAEPPYRGLARFEAGDAHLFFGRDHLTDHLMQLARRHRLTVVFGPSGSGKSSLLRAGLIPRLRHVKDRGLRPAAIRILAPGEHPLRTHAHVLSPTVAHGGGDTWLVVDQFEEVFTLCHDPSERGEFIARLLAARDPESRLRVLLGVRADFYGRCLEHPELATAIREASLPVHPMSSSELREVIVKPAAAAGLIVERTLTAHLVDQAAAEPGSLPLLSHALLETWRRRRGRTLTYEAYNTAGGLHGAITHTAETLYARLTPAQRQEARRILLRLITPGDGTPDTRRPIDVSELEEDRRPGTRTVLDLLCCARLILLEGTTVDLAHEALITAWPRLQTWLEADRERLRRVRELTEAAQVWHDAGNDPEGLYRGTRLAAAEEVFAPSEHSIDLTEREKAFLQASLAARSRNQRRRHTLFAALCLLVVVALVAGAIAWQQNQNAATARQQTLSRHLAAQSDALITTHPDLAALLAIRAYRTSPTAEATAGLYTAAELPLQRRLVPGVGARGPVALSPSQNSLAMADKEGRVWLWDVRAGRMGRALTGHGDAVNAVAFSPDGHTLASGSDDGTVRLWDPATGRVRFVLRHQGGVKAVAFSPDGRTLATGSRGGAVRWWDVRAGRMGRALTGHGDAVNAVAFSPDGRTLATADADNTVQLRDAQTGRLRMTLRHRDVNTVARVHGVKAVAFSPDGRTLATGSGDGAVRWWDVRTGRIRRTLTGHRDDVNALAYSPDGHTLATAGDDSTVRLWNPATGRTRTILAGHRDFVRSVAFSPDGRTLATGSQDGSVRLWDTAGRAIKTLNGHKNIVWSAASSPDGHSLASGSKDGTVRLWNLKTGRARTTLTGHRGWVAAVEFSPDGRMLATGGQDGTARLWDVKTGRLHTTLGHPRSVAAVEFSPDGHSLATGGQDGTVRLWNLKTGRARTTLTGHRGWVAAVEFSPDGRMLATSGQDGTARLWDVKTGRTRATFPGQKHGLKTIDFSPDGRTLAVAGDDSTVRLWDVKTGRPRAVLAGHRHWVNAVAFSPDGRTLASGSDDGTVRLWDVKTGRPRAVLAGHKHWVNAVAFSPDGHTLVSASADRTVRLWDVALPDQATAVRKICRAVGRDLTKAERAAYLPDGPARPVCVS